MGTGDVVDVSGDGSRSSFNVCRFIFVRGLFLFIHDLVSSSLSHQRPSQGEEFHIAADSSLTMRNGGASCACSTGRHCRTTIQRQVAAITHFLDIDVSRLENRVLSSKLSSYYSNV